MHKISKMCILLTLSYSVKYNKTLKHCHFICMKVYTALGESLVTNIALNFALYYICHSTLTSSCIFQQTGGSALNNTY